MKKAELTRSCHKIGVSAASPFIGDQYVFCVSIGDFLHLILLLLLLLLPFLQSV